MKKFYKTIILLLVFVFLSTYSPSNFDSLNQKNNTFFKVKNINITNNFLVKKDEINEKLINVYYKNIFFLKREDIENPLKNIYFLKKIEVKKKYPSTIILKIYETKPVAFLLKDNEKYLLDNAYSLIPFKENKSFDNLPNIFGENAEKNFEYFFSLLKKNQFPTERIKNYYYFKIGRWDLQFKNNKIIKFPYKKIEEAINKSIELINREDFQNYNMIDLRMSDKIVVE